MEWRRIVFYSETGQDWHQFSGLIEELNTHLQHKVCYVTSDRNDPGLDYQHPNFLCIWLPEGLFLTVFFQMSQSDVFVLTMMDLGNLQLKRSVYPVHYVYLFHSMGSTHMVDHANSFDHYDSLFCTGPHQVKEIRKREELKGLPAKHLFDYGHPRLEQVLREGREFRLDINRHAGKAATESQKPIVLIAPTWGDTSIFNVCGQKLIETLLSANFKVIMRPHYQSNRLTPEIIEQTRKRFELNPDFEYIGQMGETQSLFRSDILVSDWSAMALEYSLGLEKPVLFIDVPRRIRNPDWQELGIEPMEAAIRNQVGEIVAPDELELAAEKVTSLLSRRAEFIGHMRALREQMVFRMGSSVASGAAELARIADQQLRLRETRDTAHV
jgi:YidC/Oxa1 family membrane protein insertase